MNEYLHVLRNYATFTGRARRREYWLFWLINTAISFVLQLLLIPLGLNLGSPSSTPDLQGLSPLAVIVVALVVLYSLAILVPGIAVTVRRLHDAGYSGWFCLISLIPIVGGIVMIVFLATDSKPDNRWGPNPKEVPMPMFR
jgi:uncharacterized membrane protein YhaH (DUF805 family)